jgi:hypothetical protein
MTRMSGCWVVVHFRHAPPFLIFGDIHSLDGGNGGDEFVRGYDGNPLIVVLSLVSVGRARKRISGSICFSRYMFDFVIVFL